MYGLDRFPFCGHPKLILTISSIILLVLDVLNVIFVIVARNDVYDDPDSSKGKRTLVTVLMIKCFVSIIFITLASAGALYIVFKERQFQKIRLYIRAMIFLAILNISQIIFGASYSYPSIIVISSFLIIWAIICVVLIVSYKRLGNFPEQ